MTISARGARILDKVAQTDEPIIIFRAQDMHSVGVIRDYLARLWSDVNVKDNMRDAVVDKAKEFEAWQIANSVKSPDLGSESHLLPEEVDE